MRKHLPWLAVAAVFLPIEFVVLVWIGANVALWVEIALSILTVPLGMAYGFV